jgi:hypothetical protein
MTSTHWIEKLRGLAMMPVDEFSDFKKLSQDCIEQIGTIQANIFKDLDKWTDIIDSHKLLIYILAD